MGSCEGIVESASQVTRPRKDGYLGRLPGEVTLLVASRRVVMLLLTGQRSFWSDFGIEVDVDFIEVQHNFTARDLVNQPLNRS